MIKGALVAFGITLVLAIIPIVHFVTFLPAPFIGGFIGGSQANADPTKAMTMGLLMGFLMLVPAFLVLWVVGLFWETIGYEHLGLMIGLAGALAAYVALLGSLGAMLGGRVSRRHTDT